MHAEANFSLFTFHFSLKVELSILPERIAQYLYLHIRRNLLVQYIIYSIEDRHVDMIALVDDLHAVCAVIAFRYHLHLQLSCLDRISLPYHRTEDTIAREIGIHGHEQVAQICRVADMAFFRLHGIEEALHLLHCICHEHSLEVIALLESMTDTGSYGIHILQHRRILYALYVAAYACLYELVGEQLCHHLCIP